MLPAKHTPGDWQMHDDDFCPEEIYGNLDGPLEDGQVRGTLICTISGDMDDSENYANARLITCPPHFFNLTQRIAELNPDAGEIGPGMLVQLISLARIIMTKTRR